MGNKNNSCCTASSKKRPKGILAGLLYGLIPHSFCIAFALFSIIGAVTATAFLKQFLLIPYFVHFLIIVSLLLATLSSLIYLKRNGCLCSSGIKNKWKYLSTLYSATIIINLLMFFIVLPALANVDFQKTPASIPAIKNELSVLSINVDIPCTGHAALITDELEKNSGVISVKFEAPKTFIVHYDSRLTNPLEIQTLEIFKTYPIAIN